jgi:small conductance mechanosensitive channel
MVNLLTFVTYYGVLLLTALLALSILGVPLTGMVAIASAVLVTAGIALKETLADLAAAIIFYLFQPFKVGDTIETSGVTGKVIEIQLFFTVIQTASNRLVTLPNRVVQGNGITNLSALDTLRADVSLTILYSDDLELAKRLLLDLMVADARVLKEPSPVVLVQELSPNGVTLLAGGFVAFNEFWSYLASMREQIKLRFEAEGINIAPLVPDLRRLEPGS